MDSKKLFGGILILIGVALAFYGIDQLNSLPSRLMNLVGQSNTGAYMAIAGGIVCCIIGLGMMFYSRGTA
jgi:hypothetical protein